MVKFKFKNPFKKKTAEEIAAAIEEKKLKNEVKHARKEAKAEEKKHHRDEKSQKKEAKKALEAEYKKADEAVRKITKEATKKGELSNGEIIRVIATGLNIAAKSKKGDQRIQVTRVIKGVLSNVGSVFKASKTALKVKKAIQKETGLSSKDLKRMGENPEIKKVVLESKLITGLLSDSALWGVLKFESPRIHQILAIYKSEIAEEIAEFIISEPSTTNATKLKLALAALSAPNSLDTIAGIVTNNTPEIQALMDGEQTSNDGTKLADHFKKLGLSIENVKSLVPVAGKILLIAAQNQDSIATLMSKLEPIILKVMEAGEKRKKGIYDKNDDLTSDELRVAADAVYDFLCTADLKSAFTGLANDESFKQTIASIIPETVPFSIKAKQEAVELVLKFASVLVDKNHLMENQVVFKEAIAVILDETTPDKQRLENIFKLADIFISRVKSDEGKQLIKVDLKTFLQNHKAEIVKASNDFLDKNPKVAKLGINPNKVIDALTKDGMYEDILELYELFKQDRKMALAGKGLGLFIKNKDVRVVAFNVVKSAVVAFFRDTLYPTFFKRAIVNNTCHHELSEITAHATKATELTDLHSSLQEAAKGNFGFKGYALKFGEFGDLDLRDIEFKNLKMDSMSFKNTLLGSSKGLVLVNCKITGCDFSNIYVRQGDINISNSKIDAKSLLTMVDTLKEAERHEYTISTEGLKITDLQSLRKEDLNKLMESKTLKTILDNKTKEVSNARVL